MTTDLGGLVVTPNNNVFKFQGLRTRSRETPGRGEGENGARREGFHGRGLIGMCPWMGSQFDVRINYNELHFQQSYFNGVAHF